MIVSNTPVPRTQRWLRACILICAAGLLPLGVASVEAAAPEGKGDRAVDKTAGDQLLEVLGELVANDAMDGKLAFEIYVASQESLKRELVAAGKTPEEIERWLGLAMRYAIGEAKIKQAVAAGEVSEEDAKLRLAEMKNAMGGSQRFSRLDLARAGAEIRKAVAEGELTEEEGRAKMEAMRKEMAGRGERDDGMKRRIAGALSEAGIEREKIKEVMGAMRRIMAELKSEGEAFELDPKVEAHLQELGLTGEQIEFVVGLSRRVAAAYADSDRGRGLTRSDWEGIKKRIEGAVESGEMTREQADAMYKGIRERMANRGGERDRDDGMMRRIVGALSEAGIEREQIREVMGAMRKVVAEIQSEGNAFELDPRMMAYFQELGLTDEQIALVTGIAQRLAHRPEESNRGRDHDCDE